MTERDDERTRRAREFASEIARATDSQEWIDRIVAAILRFGDDERRAGARHIIALMSKEFRSRGHRGHPPDEIVSGEDHRREAFDDAADDLDALLPTYASPPDGEPAACETCGETDGGSVWVHEPGEEKAYLDECPSCAEPPTPSAPSGGTECPTCHGSKRARVLVRHEDRGPTTEERDCPSCAAPSAVEAKCGALVEVRQRDSEWRPFAFVVYDGPRTSPLLAALALVERLNDEDADGDTYRMARPSRNDAAAAEPGRKEGLS